LEACLEGWGFTFGGFFASSGYSRFGWVAGLAPFGSLGPDALAGFFVLSDWSGFDEVVGLAPLGSLEPAALAERCAAGLAAGSLVADFGMLGF
jgi:hypothetical protein